jgi:hypothetical protein
MNSDTKANINRLNIRLDTLFAAVKKLQKDDTKYGNASQSSLGGNVEALKPNDKLTEADNELYDGKVAAGCYGDMLGQCDHGCTGVSDRGSCIDEKLWNCPPVSLASIVADEAIVSPVAAINKPRPGSEKLAQCGATAGYCDSCGPHNFESNAHWVTTVGGRPCKHLQALDPMTGEKRGLHPVDYVQSCDIENGLDNDVSDCEVCSNDSKLVIDCSGMSHSDVCSMIADERAAAMADEFETVLDEPIIITPAAVYCMGGTLYEAK